MNATQHSSVKPRGRFAAWVNAKWRARRARRMEEETVACLRSMDAKLLEDIGVNIGKFGDVTPSQPSSRRRRS